MAGIEPARSSSRKRRPAIGLHPDRARSPARVAPEGVRAAKAGRMCRGGALRALLVSHEIGCHRAVSRNSGHGRPERDRTSDSPLRRRVLFRLSYGPNRAWQSHLEIQQISGRGLSRAMLSSLPGREDDEVGRESSTARPHGGASRIHVSCRAKVPVGASRSCLFQMRDLGWRGAGDDDDDGLSQ